LNEQTIAHFKNKELAARNPLNSLPVTKEKPKLLFLLTPSKPIERPFAVAYKILRTVARFPSHFAYLASILRA
jgi:hypothetical protein